ncbi:MAG: radical SAM/SPASM domain-containing protein [Candidatus Thorarchaeota archaeon]|jgi:radical SAM protein with 4Fe4S-binding SPASM domain
MIKDGKLVNPEVRIENTNFCNARCTICPREKMTRPKAVMGRGQFCNLVEQAYRLGATAIGAFGYGEPLIDLGIIEKVEYISKRGMESHITTNGSLLRDSTIEGLLNAGLSHMRFSVHAITPKTYQMVHHGLDWFAVTRGICSFVDKNNEIGHPCTTHMTVIPMHGETVEEVRELWEPLCDYLEIWKPHNWVVGRGYRSGYPTKRCYRPFSGPVQIQADGDVIPCCFLTNGEVVLGNAFTHSLKDVLEGEPYRKLQQAHKKGNLSGYPCSVCDQRLVLPESPLLYSNRDPNMEINKTSTCKVKVA